MNQQRRDERDRNVLLSAARCGDSESISLWFECAGEESKVLIDGIIKVAKANNYENIAKICSQKFACTKLLLKIANVSVYCFQKPILTPYHTFATATKNLSHAAKSET